MRMKRCVPPVLAVCLMFLSFSGCGKSNIFSWAHKAGGDSSTSALLSDAQTALTDKDYTKAMEYYQKILSSDPNNSEAIYGYAVATLANSGLDIASLVSNLIKDNANGSSERLAPALAYIAHSSSQDNYLLPESIRNNITQIRAAIDQIMATGVLPRIVSGNADGTIDPENPDVNLNVAFCLVLRAAIRAQDSGAVTFTDDYGVTFSSTSLTNADAQQIGEDVISAYQRLLVVINKLNLESDSAICDIKGNVEDLFNDYKDNLPSGINVNLDLHYDYLLHREGR